MIRWNPQSRFDSVCPLLAVSPKGRTVTKGGVISRVLTLQGRDYTGLSDDTLYGLFNLRKTFFETVNEGLSVFVQTHRRKEAQTGAKIENRMPIAAKIGMEWSKQYKECYRTHHNIVFMSSPEGLADQFLTFKGSEASKEAAESVDDAVSVAISQLQDFNPRELKGDELASYWASQINGRQLYQRLEENGILDGLLCGTGLHWPTGKNYMVYRGATDRFSAWMIFSYPATGSRNKLLEKLCQLNREFSIYQTFSRIPKAVAMKAVEDKLKNAQLFKKFGEIVEMELFELNNRLEADEIQLLNHRFAIEMYADSTESLSSVYEDIARIFEESGYRSSRERANCEALYWASRFPELEKLNPRKRAVTSENAAHFAAFPTMGEGLNRCSWGPEPVTYLKTLSGSLYGFTFHESEGDRALGNTAVIGGAGHGKTTLISFLQSQCFKYHGFRAVNFDRHHGLEVYTAFMGGEYVSFDDSVGMNPLSLPDTRANREGLTEWFIALAGPEHETEIRQQMGKILNFAYSMPPSERVFEIVVEGFGPSIDGGAREALSIWERDQAYGAYFNSVTDALSFRNPLVTFDMTTLLDSPRVLGPVSLYLFHRLYEELTSDTNGCCVFVDELPKYLKSPILGPKIAELLRELRKKNGVFISATQDANSILSSEWVDAFLPNVATFILFPDPKAKAEHYMGQLNLTENEFDWVKEPHHRQVLIKRRDGTSAILQTDLASLGAYLKVFDSSNNRVNLMRHLRGKDNENWKGTFLAS